MKIELEEFVEKALKSLQRFPVCLAFLIALSLQLILLIISGQKLNVWTFFFSAGMFVALLLHLISEDWNESRLSRMMKGKNALVVWGVPFLILAIDSYFLHKVDNVSDELLVAHAAAILALLLAICFLPFRKEKDDRKVWHFVFRMVLGIAVALLVGMVMYGGLCLLYFGSVELFAFEGSSKVIGVLTVLCFVTISSLLFFIRIPDAKDMREVVVFENPFLLNVAKWLFLPLVLLYIVVLYAYGIKILVTLTLPKGTLSLLVSALMLGIVGLSFLLYPHLYNAQHKGYEKRIMNVLPLVVLPLIVLMSVGIIRRFTDYGVTANRLYLLTLNLWFYVVAIGLWLTKHRRIHWVCISFVALLVLTSCHPWNYFSIYRHILVSRITAVAEKYQLILSGLDADGLKAKLKNMPEDESQRLYTAMVDLGYFDRHYFENHISRYVPWQPSLERFMKDTGSNVSADSYSMTYCYTKSHAQVPEGYSHVEYITTAGANLRCDDSESCDYNVACGMLCNDSTFVFHSSKVGRITLQHKGLDDDKPLVGRSDDGQTLLQVKKLRIVDSEPNHLDMYFQLDGYLFVK